MKKAKQSRKSVKTARKHSSRLRLPFILVLSALIVTSVIGFWVYRANAATVTNRALILGDSITFESASQITAKFAPKKTWSVSMYAYPGMALCDMLVDLESRLNTINPTVVVMETQGNTTTECMRDGNGNLPTYGSAAWLEKYRADLHVLLSAVSARGIKAVLVSPLPTNVASVNVAVTSLGNLEREVAGSYSKVSISNGPRNAVTKSGKFTWTKPCLSTETSAMGCSGGQITVRNPDSVHLCPTPLNQYVFLNGCPAYSSGAVRYGNAMVTTTVNPPAPIVP